MTMLPDDADDFAVDALLRSSTADSIADDGFTAAVMQRVQADDGPPHATLDAAEALARWGGRQAAARRGLHWRLGGAAAGLLVAAVPFWLGSGLPLSLQPPQIAALVLACAAAAWGLAATAQDSD